MLRAIATVTAAAIVFAASSASADGPSGAGAADDAEGIEPKYDGARLVVSGSYCHASP